MSSLEPDQNNPLDAAALGADDPIQAKGSSEGSERWLRVAVENSSDFVMIFEADATIRYVTPAVQRVLGYRPEDLVGTRALDYVHPEDLEHMSKSFAEAVEKPGFQPPIEYRARTADGSWRHMEAIRSNFLDDPQVAGVVANVRDVTERKEAEERFRSLVQNASDVILVMEADQTVRYISPAVERVLGYKPEEVLGKDNFRVVHPDDMARVEELTVEAVQSPGTTFSIEVRLRRKDGSWRHVESSFTSLLDDPAVGGIVINSRDITERKWVEEALRESEERFRSTFDEAAIGMTLNDLDGRFLKVNRSLCEMLGYSEEQLLATTFLALTHPEDLTADHDAMRRMMEGEIDSFQTEKRCLHADGHVVWVLLNASVVRDQEGDPLYFIAQLQDITERKKAEAKVVASEAELRALFEAMEDVILVLDAEGRYLRIAPTNPSLLYKPPAELIGKTLHEVFPQEQAEMFLRHIRQALETQQTVYMEYSLPIGGEEVWFSGTISSMSEDRVFFVARDITEHKRAEEALKESERYLRTIVGNVPVVLFALDREGVFALSEGKGLEALGLRPGEVVGRSVFEVYSDVPEITEYVRRTLDGEEIVATVEVGELAFETFYTPLLDEGGEVVSVIGVAGDVTERRRAEERLHHQAFHDLLTELPNRQLFMDRLKQALRRTKRRKGRKKKVAVLFMDLDNFKHVNDSLGHEVGDRLLVAVGERIRGSLRPEDTLARFGGDEFTVLVENVEDPAGAVRVAERIIEAHREPFVLEGRELFVKPSIGITLGEARTTSAEYLLRDADTAMYQAKGKGLGYVVFETVMYEQALRRLKMENDLRRAVEAEEFAVHYQPIIDLRSGEEVWGVEALVRWQHPERGLLDPKEFVPAAEESGLVVPMGERVLKVACEQAMNWQERYPHVPPLVMAVNLSARQLGHPDIAKTVEGMLRETGLEACCLSLDITETVYVQALEGNTAALNELKRLGIRISIDDFGTGYSSLSYLKRLPADALKIDRSFIRGLGEDVEDMALVQMIIDLAHTLGMEVVAEGVESADQAEQLKEMGCDLGQGYHFAQPLPREAVPKFLAR